MSNSKTPRKNLFSRSFFVTIVTMVVLAGFILVLIFTTKWQSEIVDYNLTPEADITESTGVSYDKNQILIDTTNEPLEIVELPSLEK